MALHGQDWPFGAVSRRFPHRIAVPTASSTQVPFMANPDRDDILARLATVPGPDGGGDIVSLGLVNRREIHESNAGPQCSDPADTHDQAIDLHTSDGSADQRDDPTNNRDRDAGHAGEYPVNEPDVDAHENDQCPIESGDNPNIASDTINLKHVDPSTISPTVNSH